MKFKLFFTMLTLIINCQIFSMTIIEQQILNGKLIEAIKQTNNAQVIDLIEAGADINAKDEGSCAPLHHAALCGNAEIVELLLFKGVDINPKNNDGETPLHYAARYRNANIVQLLLSMDADVNAKSNKDETSLHFATCPALAHNINAEERKSRQIVLLSVYHVLLRQAKNPNLKRDKDPNKDLLKKAIGRGYYGLVKLLLAKGMNPQISDLQLAKEMWQTAQFKESYKAIGRLLVEKLSLTSKIGSPSKGALSKHGIAGAYGGYLNEYIAHNIAKFIE